MQITRPLAEDPATDPIIDARLADGSRVAACRPAGAAGDVEHHPPASAAPAVTIEELTASGLLPTPVVEAAAVLGAERIPLISGGIG